MQRWLIGFGVLGACTMAAEVNGAADCKRASDELRAAQVTLSAAVRHCDEANQAYGQCVQQKRDCSAEKRTADDATDARKRAQASYRAAVQKQQASCGRK